MRNFQANPYTPSAAGGGQWAQPRSRSPGSPPPPHSTIHDPNYPPSSSTATSPRPMRTGGGFLLFHPGEGSWYGDGSTATASGIASYSDMGQNQASSPPPGSSVTPTAPRTRPSSANPATRAGPGGRGAGSSQVNKAKQKQPSIMSNINYNPADPPPRPTTIPTSSSSSRARVQEGDEYRGPHPSPLPPPPARSGSGRSYAAPPNVAMTQSPDQSPPPSPPPMADPRSLLNDTP